MSISDKKKFQCCACQISEIFPSGLIAQNNGWSLEEDKDSNPYDLCPICAKQLSCIDQRNQKLMGINITIEPPKKELTPSISEIQSTSPRPNNNGITVRANFKMVSIDIISGEKAISGNVSPKEGAIEIDSNLASKLELDKDYFINILK